MATLTATITYPDSKAVDIRDTIASAFDYDRLSATMNPVPTKAQFIQYMVNQHLKTWLINTYESEKSKSFVPPNPEIQ
jgi:hypothetical protein